MFAHIPAMPKNRLGRALFAGLQFSDSPTPPLRKMRLRDSAIKAAEAERSEVVTINTVDQSSRRRSPKTLKK